VIDVYPALELLTEEVVTRGQNQEIFQESEHPHYTGMRRITTFPSTTDRIYDGDPHKIIIL